MATSKLQQYVKSELKKYNRRFMENYRPKWLTDEKGRRLELDFFLEGSRIAIEVQGEQHFEYIPFFHKSPDDFVAQLKRDKIKKELCQAMGIHLIEIKTEQQVRGAILQIMDLSHKPEALDKIIKRNKYKEIVKNLAPNEACLYHAQEIKKYQDILSKLNKKRNKNPAIAGTVKNALRQIKQHKEKLIELANGETKSTANYLLNRLFHSYKKAPKPPASQSPGAN